MNQLENNTLPVLPYRKVTQKQYTIIEARTDIEYLGRRFDELEAERHALREEVDHLRHDEWRALHLCDMLRRRVDILESLVLKVLNPEGKALLTHQIITEIRSAEKAGLQ